MSICVTLTFTGVETILLELLLYTLICSMTELPPFSSLSLTSGVYNQSLDESSPIPEFVDTVDSAYLCSKCHQIVRQACQTTCGHRLCQHCVDELGRTHGSESFQCPAREDDCEHMTVEQIRPDFSGRRYILSLRVYCCNKAYGCPEIMQWRKLKDHIDKNHCQYNVQSCPNNCGATNIRRSQIGDHLSVCPREKKPCKFHRFGCEIQGTDALLRQHYEQDMSRHLEVLFVGVAELELTNTKLQGTCDDLASNLTQTRAKCDELLSANEALTRQVAAKMTALEQSTMRTLAVQSEGIIKLEQKSSQIQADFQRELTAVNTRFGQVERQVQGAPETGGRRGGTAAGALPEEVRVQLINHDKTIAIHDVRLAELDLRLQCTETTNYDGVLIWKVTEYRRRKRDAVNGGTLSVYSQPFYTSRYGYKLCARVYLNGDGAGRGNHVSFFLVVMQGDYDDLLTWPFRQKVTLCLLDQRTQRRHLADTFRPDPTSTSFQKPNSPMNVASGCPLFIAHQALEVDDSPYLMNDMLYFKIVIDTSDLINP